MMRSGTRFLAMVVFATTVPPVLVHAAEVEKPRLITVTGTARVAVVPDEVFLRVGVDTLDKDVALAKSKNGERVRQVLEVVRKHGVKERCISTDYVSIDPRHTSHGDEWLFLGYQVSQTIGITLGDISQYESLITELLKVGVNRVDYTDFRTIEPRKHKDQARALAIQAAKEKATAMAALLDQRIGRPHAITERARSSSSWQDNNELVISNSVADDMGGATIAPGQIAIAATVTISFELVDAPSKAK